MGSIYKQYFYSNNTQNVKEWYCENKPVVSIIILNFNKAYLTIKCLESIWSCTTGSAYEIIVVDNGSSEDEFNQLIELKGPYQLLRLEINRYFGEGNNIGAELAKGDFLLFMNNDVTVTPDWLMPLLKVFSIHTDCGVAGPKFIYPDGKLQEAGALIDVDGTSVQIGKYQNPNDPHFKHSRIVDYISAATILMRKLVFEKVLGFDFIYEPAYYEDSDLCLKIGQLGLKTYYIAESCVIHHENATTSDNSHGLRLNSIVESNRQKFIKRWNFYLNSGKHLPVLHQNLSPVSNITYSVKNKTAAVYTPYNINPGGGERYILTIIEHLINEGYKTWLILPEIISKLRLNKIASILNLNLNLVNITTYDLASKMPKFDLFLAMGNEIVPPVEGLGNRNFFLCQFPFPTSIELIDCRSNWMNFYSSIIVYSEFSKKNVIKKIENFSLPLIDVSVISPPVDMQKFDVLKPKRNIITVGRFFVGGHCKQQDMMIRTFRRIHELGIDIDLHLVGSLPPEPEHREYLFECQRLADGLPIHFHVDAEETTLMSLYQESSIYWHAAGFNIETEVTPEKCEHFGISIVEAMSAGVIPIVVNNGGPSTIVQHGSNGYCYETEDDLMELTLLIFLQEESTLRIIREKARERATLFTKELFYKNLNNLIS